MARLAAVGAVGALLLGETTGRVAWGAGIVMEASGWIWLLMAVTVIAVAALAFGVLGRLAALVLVAVASAPLALILIGFFTFALGLAVIGLWVIYRVLRGWLTLKDGKPIGPMPA